jgi:hypothetical protein
VDGRNVRIVSQHALAEPGQVQHLLAVDAHLERLAHVVVVERRLVHAHADDKGLGRRRRVDADARQVLDRLPDFGRGLKMLSTWPLCRAAIWAATSSPRSRKTTLSR